ncbi:MAG: hypothetical protein Q9219_003563 [cf. Caloplaca sp. 3 TL-2023]
MNNPSPELPSAIEISTILQPWRTLLQRQVADTSSTFAAVWLRTCYSEGSDEKHEELVEPLDMYMAVDGDHRLLNDSDLYDFGADWQRVFQYIPELMTPSGWNWSYWQERQQEALRELTAYAERGLAGVDQGLIDNLTGVTQGTPAIGFQGAQLEQEVAKLLQSEVHRNHVVTWLVIEDEEALETGLVAVVFIDGHGKVVRSKRVGAGEAEQMGGFWADHSWYEISEWEDGEYGPEYQSGGSCGNLLLDNIRNAQS